MNNEQNSMNFHLNFVRKSGIIRPELKNMINTKPGGTQNLCDKLIFLSV